MARHCETSGGKREGKEEQGNGVGRRKEHHANIPKRTGVGRRKELTLTYRDGPEKNLDFRRTTISGPAPARMFQLATHPQARRVLLRAPLLAPS